MIIQFTLVQHSIEIYCQKVFRSYLEKQPEYVPPTPSSKGLPEMKILKPTLTAVGIHDHGSQLAVAVEGRNLWFCYQLSVSGHSVAELPARDLSGTSIQFNILIEDQKKDSKIKVRQDSTVKVILHSHFSRPLKQDVQAIQKVSQYVHVDYMVFIY